MLKIMSVVCALAASAVADAKFVVHPTDGGLAASSNPCGEVIQDFLNKIVEGVPTIALGKSTMTLTRTGFAAAPATKTFVGDPAVGYWEFTGGTQWLISVRSVPGKRPVVEIQIALDVNASRKLDQKVCYEKWQGMAAPQ